MTDAPSVLAEVVQGTCHHLVDRRRLHVDRHGAGLQAAHVEQVVHQRGQPVQGGVRALEQLAAVLGIEVEVEAEQGGDGCLGRRERRAEVVADGGQQRGADLVGLRERSCLGGGPAQPDVVQHDRGLRGERADEALVLGLQQAVRTARV